MSKVDPLAAALDAVTTVNSGGTVGKVVHLFSDRPQVLDSIRRARFGRKLSYREIAKVLSGGLPEGQTISESAVKNWLDTQQETS